MSTPLQASEDELIDFLRSERDDHASHASFTLNKTRFTHNVIVIVRRDDGGKIQGFVFIKRCSSCPKHKRLWHIYVAKAHRRKGIGSSLVQEAECDYQPQVWGSCSRNDIEFSKRQPGFKTSCPDISRFPSPSHIDCAFWTGTLPSMVEFYWSSGLPRPPPPEPRIPYELRAQALTAPLNHQL